MDSTKKLLLDCLDHTKFGKNTGRANVTGIHQELSDRYTANSNWGKKIVGNPCQSITIGYIRPRHKMKTDPRELTKLTLKNLDLYELCKKYIKELQSDFEYTTICVNKNLVCKPHTDSKNDSLSLIIGVGDYEGGDLFLDGVKYSIKDNFVIFNGCKQTHWNNEITSGTKYSLVFYKGG